MLNFTEFLLQKSQKEFIKTNNNMNHVEETQQKQRRNILRQWSTIDKFRYKIVFIICAQAVEDAYLRTECIASIKA